MKSSTHLKASIDMGTTKVSAMIAECQGPYPRIIGVGTAPSEGLKQGVVVDIERAASSVERAVADAEHMAGLSVKTFAVGVAGEHIRSMNSRGVIAIPNLEAEITKEDVARALDASQKFSLPYDREIIHTLPQEYIVDNQRGIRQPAGMYGSRLEARVHVVTASRPALDNVEKTCRLAGVDIGELVMEPLASSYAVVTDEEREIGVMLLDIGGGTTDVMLFVEGGVVASGVIGLGGNNVTNDVAYGLRTSQQHAEAIKIQHGCALSSMVNEDETIDVVTIGFRETRSVTKHLISGIIEPRVSELFSLINGQITGNKLKKSLGAGLVLTGGSALLEGARELAEQIFDLPVRIGTPGAVDGLAEVVSHPKYATGVGLLHPNVGARSRYSNKSSGARRLRHSLTQLKRAIASFI